jgi:hypothetical protein
MLLKPSECQEIQSMRQRADEFLAFLRIDRETPARLDLNLVIDNYSTHKTEKVKRWFD